jgi:hypothetical protein
MRALLAAIVLSCMPASALADASEDLARASRMLAANWRPFQAPARGGAAEAAFSSACDGALAEMTWLDGRLPEDMTPAALGAIRTSRGLILIPTEENPATFFLFASPEMQGLTSGLATIRVVNAAEGRLNLADVGGALVPLQLGEAGSRTMMRILRENQEPLLFVACAPTAR